MPLAKSIERGDETRTIETVPCSSSRLDPIRRFVPTPFSMNLQLLGKIVRVETNSQRVLDLALQFFGPYRQISEGDPEFRWRIVSEPNGSTGPGAPTYAFSDRDLSFVNMGQRSFLAVDADTRLGIAFLDEKFAEARNPRFTSRPPLGTLFCMSAASLGLTSLSAACVALGEAGVLLLGEPNSGKTTASYVAATLGMEFLADQLVFLESASSGIRAWGDPFPAVFRPTTLQFFPDLRSEVHPSSYGDLSFYFFDKSKFQSEHAHSVTPLCSVVLQRAAVRTAPRLVPMSARELSRHLSASLLFRDGERFQSQHDASFAALAKIPAYGLSYGEDPAVAASIVRDLLVNQVREDAR
jgi:hypothetical protein